MQQLLSVLALCLQQRCELQLSLIPMDIPLSLWISLIPSGLQAPEAEPHIVLLVSRQLQCLHGAGMRSHKGRAGLCMGVMLVLRGINASSRTRAMPAGRSRL